MPGIEVHGEVISNGDDLVSKIEMAPGAFEAIQNGENQKPGLYSVSVNNQGELKIIKNKKDIVTEQGGRNEVIADGECESAEEAASRVLTRLSAILTTKKIH